MATLEERIQRLEDIKEIQALKIAYARAADDRYNADRLAALFTEDAVWDGGEKFGMHRGRQAIHDFFAPISEAFTFALHYYMGPTIDIAPSGVAATGTGICGSPRRSASAPSLALRPMMSSTARSTGAGISPT